MDGARFDRIGRTLAGLSRRRATAVLLGGAVAALPPEAIRARRRCDCSPGATRLNGTCFFGCPSATTCGAPACGAPGAVCACVPRADGGGNVCVAGGEVCGEIPTCADGSCPRGRVCVEQCCGGPPAKFCVRPCGA